MVAFMDNSSEFLQVCQTKVFVDKSLFLQTIMSEGNDATTRHLITAPCQFGKSTILDMLNQFFSDQSDIKIDEVFKKLKIHQQYPDFYKDNFRRYPVIYLDFTCGTTCDNAGALDSYRWAIHKAYRDHDYLLDSELSKDELDHFKSWCCVHGEYENFGEDDVSQGLFDLVNMIKHERKNDVIVLIDNYDSVINKAMYHPELDENAFRDVVELTVTILNKLLNGNSLVHLAVLTGVSYFSTNDLLNIEGLKIYRFLDDHVFHELFGYTDDEVAELMKREYLQLKNKEELFTLAKENYQYINQRGDSIYNFTAFTRFLESKELFNYCRYSEDIATVIEVIEHKEIAEIIHLLLKNDGIGFQDDRFLFMKGVCELKLAFSARHLRFVNTNYLLCYLMDLGLLSYHHPAVEDRSDRQVKLANPMVRREMNRQFQTRIIELCDIPLTFQSAIYSDFVVKMTKTKSWYWKELFGRTKLECLVYSLPLL